MRREEGGREGGGREGGREGERHTLLPSEPYWLLPCSEMKLTSPKLNIPLAIGSILWHVSIPIGWTPWPMELEFLSVRCEVGSWCTIHKRNVLL